MNFPRNPGVGQRHCRARTRSRYPSRLRGDCHAHVWFEVSGSHNMVSPVRRLGWDRDPGDSQIVVCDIRTADVVAVGVPGANAADAFRHPFRYLP
jgi:hypothetical protein